MSYDANKQMFEGYIYLIENKVNGKVYIGQTSRSVQKRFKEHMHLGDTYRKNKKSKNSVLYKAIEKYKQDNFACKTIKTCLGKTKAELKNMLNYYEIEYIDKYNSIIPNGYNMTIGGNFDGCMGNNRRPVAQYDLSGNFIKAYNSMSEAYEETGFISLFSAISKGYLISGYQWIYIDDVNKAPIKIGAYVGVKTKRIVQIDFNGNLIVEFNSINEASEKTGINNVAIGDCIANRNRRFSAGGYQWVQLNYGEDITQFKFDKYSINRNRNSKGIKRHEINMYSLDNKYINTFDTTIEALKYIDREECNNSGITSCCSKRQKTAFGYKWFYANDPNQPDKSRIAS